MLCKKILRFLKKKDGTAAIEMSILAWPFVMMTLAIVEVAMMFASATLLEGATGSASRLLRTGQVQTVDAANQEQMFRDAICDYMTVLISCDDVVVEVQQLASFNDFDNMDPQYDEDGNLVSRGFDAGGSNDRVLVRTAVRYDMLTPLIGPLLAGPDNSFLFMSTVVLQSEPYEFDPDEA